MYTHLCEHKRRWMDRDAVANRIGYNSWLQFYSSTNLKSTKKTYLDFTKSSYYLAFVKFGSYCNTASVLNPSRYVDWLLKNKIRIDTWNSDGVYTRYLCEYLREEDPFDAITRSVMTTTELSTDTGIQPHDMLRWGNVNKLCYAITTGRISPWMLYHSRSGKEFLDKLDGTQVRTVFDYINPELWAVVFKRREDTVIEIKTLLQAGGY